MPFLVSNYILKFYLCTPIPLELLFIAYYGNDEVVISSPSVLILKRYIVYFILF